MVLTSSVFSSSNMISRDHADIIGVKGASGRIEKYHINDRSLNGTYINDQRVNSTMQIMEGDVIKFGHMNGAAVRPGQTAPQANAEFAFMVERANPSYDYIGFVDGRRVRPVTCSGDTEYCTEIEGRTIEHGDVARPTVMQSTKTSHTQSVSQNLSTPCTTATVSSAAGTNPMAGLMWPGTLGYNQSLPGFAYSGFPVNPAYLQPPQWAQHLQVLHQQAQQSGFRVPDVFGASACMTSANGPPSTSASLFPLAQRGFALQNNPLVNSLLTTAATPATNQSSSQQQMQHHQQQLAQQHAQQQAMQEEKPTVVPQTVQEKEAELSSGTTEPVSASSSATQASNSAPVAKVPVASPPMECDSSVPSPPKTTATVTSTVAPASLSSRTTASPLRKEEDVRSERSFVESPQPPRAPAPAPWDSTPSPRPRDYSPDRESTATRDTEKERDCEKDKEHREEKEKEKEEPREQVKKKPTKEVRAVASSQSRPRTKTNEIARLLEDLCEGSWVNTVRRVSSTSRRPTDEVIIERNSKKEKKRMEKNRKKERSREQRASLASSSSLSSMPAPGSKPARRKLKQLSDDSSTSVSSSDSEEVMQPRKPVPVEKKKVESKRKNAPPPLASDMSSNRSTESDSDSEEQIATKKGNKRRLSPGDKKVGEKKKAIASASATAVAKKKPKTVARSREKDADTDEEAITQHDPTTTCALNSECTRPQSEQVGWIFCDDCQNWFHNICILGREEAPDDEFFYCGCKAKKKAKKR